MNDDSWREHIAAIIFRLVEDFQDHPWNINNGKCDEFADALHYRIQNEINLDAEFVFLGEEGIPHFCIKCKDFYFDAEEPYGTSKWEWLPLCARYLRGKD